jgi:hypothetical protein
VAGRLALEVRDSDVLLARFYTFDCRSQTLKQLEQPERLTWWLGLEDAHQGMVYLHGYGDRKVGQHKGIRALIAATGEEAWHRPELSFYGIDSLGILAYVVDSQEANMQLLDVRYGKILQNDINQKQAAVRVDTYSVERYRDVIHPVLYQEREEYFVQVRDFLSQQLQCEAVRTIEYAETDEWMVISYYVATEKNKLDNFLAVFDLNGILHLNDLLASGLNGVGSDTFFIFMRSLYFVQNKDSLTAYSLNYIVTT